jgi:hypothetical protein
MIDLISADPLSVVIKEIEMNGEKATSNLLAAGLRMRELRARVEGGEVGKGIKWFEWVLQHVHLKRSRLRDIKRVAEAEDPEGMAERMLKMNHDRVNKYRERKARAALMLEPERKALIAWAKTASLARVSKYMALINQEEHMLELRKATRAANDDLAKAA